ncbi:MAG: hypothetical protein HY764_01575 [Candidatus Portnoybacteria bacterium]|nr:hypothetical protein [Candidatus Portnoybacteria bacterium]
MRKERMMLVPEWEERAEVVEREISPRARVYSIARGIVEVIAEGDPKEPKKVEKQITAEDYWRTHRGCGECGEPKKKPRSVNFESTSMGWDGFGSLKGQKRGQEGSFRERAGKFFCSLSVFPLILILGWVVSGFLEPLQAGQLVGNLQPGKGAIILCLISAVFLFFFGQILRPKKKRASW